MTCPTCKNPIQDNSKECEWCGNEIIDTTNKLNVPLGKILRIVYNGNGSSIYNHDIEVYINGVSKYKSTLKKGVVFDVENMNLMPIIQFKLWLDYYKIDIPKLDIDKNYLITVDFSKWKGFKSTPKSIEEI